MKRFLLSLVLVLATCAPAHAAVDGTCDYVQGSNSTQQLANGCAEEIGAILTTLTGLSGIYAPLAHVHAMADVTGLSAALAGKLDASAVSAFALTVLDDASAASMRTTLGLGGLAVLGAVGSAEITNDSVSNADLANMAAGTIKGTVAGGDPTDMTAATVRGLLNVADGATANASDATLLSRANHTGTQLAATISDFASAVAALITGKANIASPTFTGTVTLPAGQVVNGVTLTTGGAATEYLSADGTYTEPAGGGGAFDPITTFKFYSDYIGLTTDGGLIAEQGGTGASVTIGTIAGEPGAVFGTTGTSSTGRAGLLSSLTAIRLGTGEYVYEARVYIETLSTGTERYSYRVGFLDANSANENQTDAVAFVYDEGGVSAGSTASANWQTVTASSASRTWNTGLVPTAVVTGAYNRFTITVNAAGTEATFAINGSTVATHTANIPNGSGRELGFGWTLKKSIGTGVAERVFHDYIAVTGTLTVTR